MAKNTYTHRVDPKGKVKVVAEQKLPKHLRGYDPAYDVHSFTEGPISRLLNRRHR